MSAVSTTSPARAGRLSRLAGLYAIVGDDDPVACAGAAIAGGARAVQVRMKRAPAGAILEVVRRVVAVAQGRALVLVNDRPDLALLAGADGVHVGDDDLPPREARAILGPDLLVGRTARTAADARAALLAGADHVGFGPVFPSATKPLALPPRGLEALADACAAIRPAPVVAVSGIDLGNVAAVGRAGAACAAVIGALFDAGGASGADGRARALAAEFARGAGERR